MSGEPMVAHGKLKVIPAYLLVIERTMSFISLSEVDEISKNVDSIIKQRDLIVSQIYKTMLFLASLLILVFLIEISLVEIPSTVSGVKLTIGDSGTPSQGSQNVVNNVDIFIFGFLL